MLNNIGYNAHFVDIIGEEASISIFSFASLLGLFLLLGKEAAMDYTE